LEAPTSNRLLFHVWYSPRHATLTPAGAPRLQERHELMQSQEDEMNALMDKRREKEEQYMEARRRRVDEDQRQLEAQRVQVRLACSPGLWRCLDAFTLHGIRRAARCGPRPHARPHLASQKISSPDRPAAFTRHASARC